MSRFLWKSLGSFQRFAEALRSLDTVVVIDVAMTETARLADYVLPAATQYEKWEATFFNFEFPRNYFHLRKPLFQRPENCLPEAEFTPAWLRLWLYALNARLIIACMLGIISAISSKKIAPPAADSKRLTA